MSSKTLAWVNKEVETFVCILGEEDVVYDVYVAAAAIDIRSLTLGSLKLQYMSHLGCESLSPEAKTCMKRVVGEELLNMQEEQIDQNEKQRSRKRQTKASSDEENESSSSMSDEIGEEEDKDSKKGAPGKKWDGKQKGIKEVGGPESRKQQAKSSTDEESSSQSDESSEDCDNVPKKEEVSDTRFLVCILEECSTCLSICLMQEENKAVLRLKRYISLCGARRNYKKLFEGCGSIRSKVSVLKKELEDLGIEGLPSIDKCKKARKKLEEAKELAELDVSNIITTQGRPTRRGPSPWKEPHSSPAARYKRTVNSGSEEDSPAEKGPYRSRHWGNLQGIISDDGESD
uniref:HIRA interacting protein 3 n=1 Tax=Gadus morhua TaxID=8049 RepID=A0A8C5C2W0_GADMO